MSRWPWHLRCSIANRRRCVLTASASLQLGWPMPLRLAGRGAFGFVPPRTAADTGQSRRRSSRTMPTRWQRPQMLCQKSRRSATRSAAGTVARCLRLATRLVSRAASRPSASPPAESHRFRHASRYASQRTVSWFARSSALLVDAQSAIRCAVSLSASCNAVIVSARASALTLSAPGTADLSLGRLPAKSRSASWSATMPPPAAARTLA